MRLKTINLPFFVKKPVLALGAETKNRVCFALGSLAYISDVHQDLANPREYARFENVVTYFLRKKPRLIAHDLHPEYLSTKFALALRPVACSLRPVRHHHAHIASCMADNGLKDQKVIGVAFDGTGLGDDTQLWGSEFLICGYSGYKRAAHLREVALIGAESAIREPYRLALFWLYEIYNDTFLKLDIDFMRRIDKKKWEFFKRMYLSKFNSPLASSMGRLFDAAASLILARYQASGEAELAISLERKATLGANSKSRAYPLKIKRSASQIVIDPSPLIQAIVRDLESGVSKESISYNFHVSIAEMIAQVCAILRKKERVNRVALSGGVFQNKLLLRLSLGLLYQQGFTVLTHRQVSCNDECISLGQVSVVAGGRRKCV